MEIAYVQIPNQDFVFNREILDQETQINTVKLNI